MTASELRATASYEVTARGRKAREVKRNYFQEYLRPQSSRQMCRNAVSREDINPELLKVPRKYCELV